LTIEHPGWIDHALRPLMGNWVFGCDVCQIVCPWQRFAIQTQETAFFPASPDRAAPKLAQLLLLDASGFDALFRGTPIQRIGRERLVRNACIAAGNSRDPELISNLQFLLSDPSPLVRGHAAWGLARLAGARAAPRLRQVLYAEADPAARRDLETTVAEMERRAR
jgi:epoxyqueuosine reductase